MENPDQLRGSHHSVHFSVGIHPREDFTPVQLSQLRPAIAALSADGIVRGIGETGN